MGIQSYRSNREGSWAPTDVRRAGPFLLPFEPVLEPHVFAAGLAFASRVRTVYAAPECARILASFAQSDCTQRQLGLRKAVIG